MSAEIISFARERARRTVPERLYYGRTGTWWALQTASLAVVAACVWLFILWVA